MWAGHKPRKQWADIGPKRLGQSRPKIFSFSFFFGPGQTQPIGLGQNWPGPIANELFTEREQ